MLLNLKKNADGKAVKVEIEFLDERLRKEKSILDYSKKKDIYLIIIAKKQH